MSDLFGNHIVGFPTRRLNYNTLKSYPNEYSFKMQLNFASVSRSDNVLQGHEVQVIGPCIECCPM